MTYSKIRLEADGPVAVVTLADPATLNAASLAMVDELVDALERVAADGSDFRAVVLTGEGRGFCSGANLTDAARAAPPGQPPDASLALVSHYNPLVSRLRDLPVPLVTAVNGGAAGVGCSLALLGDLVVASEEAYFLQAFRHIGLVPDGGSTWLLPRAVGKARAMEMALLGDRLPARTALEWGLVNRVTTAAGLMDEALGLARRLAEGPNSLGITRRLIWSSLDAGWEEQLDAERAGQQAASRTQDFLEGIASFLKKRPPAFTGR
ncbi:MAG TPA: enoyl-CoA hydratase/isomerase [Caulobacteraceae bacterium]|jgi:2-(1,2-epoxy-1,2-dihydrophenyl)acetyl-CoA isomerase